ncbi:MAG: hypothetical protein HQL01_09925 [Nitrospirae bacterium]|nr:hypothetical protein [Nitrospirota bacterium]
MQIERTFEHFTALLGKEKIALIYFSSVLHIEKYLIAELTRQIAVKCEIFDPLAKIMGDKGFIERDYLLPAVAVALSDNSYTPNILHVRKDKNIEAKRNLIEKVIFIVFITVILCSVIFYGKQESVIKKKMGVLGGLTGQLYQSGQKFDNQSIITIIDHIKMDRHIYSNYIRRYVSVAVINEIASMVPQDVYLTSCKIDIAPQAASGGRPGNSHIVIDGIITGNIEAVMANFIARISTSPMLSDVDVKKSLSESSESKLPFKKFQIEAGLVRQLE